MCALFTHVTTFSGEIIKNNKRRSGELIEGVNVREVLSGTLGGSCNYLFLRNLVAIKSLQCSSIRRMKGLEMQENENARPLKRDFSFYADCTTIFVLIADNYRFSVLKKKKMDVYAYFKKVFFLFICIDRPSFIT